MDPYYVAQITGSLRPYASVNKTKLPTFLSIASILCQISWPKVSPHLGCGLGERQLAEYLSQADLRKQ